MYNVAGCIRRSMIRLSVGRASSPDACVALWRCMLHVALRRTGRPGEHARCWLSNVVENDVQRQVRHCNATSIQHYALWKESPAAIYDCSRASAVGTQQCHGRADRSAYGKKHFCRLLRGELVALRKQVQKLRDDRAALALIQLLVVKTPASERHA